MPTLAPIKIVIAGVDKFSKNFDKIQGRLNKISSGMNKAGRGMTAGVTLPIVGAGIALIRTAARFDLSMNKVRARGTEIGKTFKQMREQAKLLGDTTQFSASQAAGAMEKLSMAGFDTGQIYKALPDILNLAAAADIDIARAADIASNIMGTFGLKAKDMAEISDTLAVAVSSANIDMEMLAQTIEDSGSDAAQFGAKLKDVAVAAGFLGNMGIQGTKAATVMKNLFKGLSGGAPKITKTFKALGVVIDDGQGGIRGYADILGDLAGAMVGMDKLKKLRIMENLFGSRVKGAIGAMTNAMGRSDVGLQKIKDAMGDVTGKAKEMADIINSGVTGSMRGFMSALEGVAIAFAESGLLDMFSKFLKVITKFLRKISKTNPHILKMAAVFLIVLAVIGPLLLIGSKVVLLFTVLSSVVSFLIPIIASIGSTFAAVGGLISAFGMVAILPLIPMIALVGVAMVALGIVFYGVVKWIITRWDKIVPFFKLFGIVLGKVFDKIKDGPVGSFFTWIGSKIKWLTDKIGEFLDSGLGKFTQFIGNIVGGDLMKEAGFKDFKISAEAPLGAGASAGGAVGEKAGWGRQMVEHRLTIDGKNMGGATLIPEKGEMDVSTDTGDIMGGGG